MLVSYEAFHGTPEGFGPHSFVPLKGDNTQVTVGLCDLHHEWRDKEALLCKEEHFTSEILELVDRNFVLTRQVTYFFLVENHEVLCLSVVSVESYNLQSKGKDKFMYIHRQS